MSKVTRFLGATTQFGLGFLFHSFSVLGFGTHWISWVTFWFWETQVQPPANWARVGDGWWFLVEFMGPWGGFWKKNSWEQSKATIKYSIGWWIKLLCLKSTAYLTYIDILMMYCTTILVPLIQSIQTLQHKYCYIVIIYDFCLSADCWSLAQRARMNSQSGDPPDGFTQHPLKMWTWKARLRLSEAWELITSDVLIWCCDTMCTVQGTCWENCMI